MNEAEAYEFIAQKLGVSPDMVPYLVEVALDQTIINPVLSETIKKLGPLLDLRPGKTVLDLACGKAGVTLPMVYTYKVRLTGVDVMPDFIREAWSRAEYTGLYELCDFIFEDAARFVAGARGQWDVVVVMGALTHIWDTLDQGLAAVKPVVKPGGFLVLGHPYQKPGGEQDPHYPFLSKEETSARLAEVGEVAAVFDDGDEGWESYIQPQRKAMAKLREKAGDNQMLTAFLDEWARQQDWERNNLGYAVWAVKIG
ncbi:MAG: class I SAM-dependent methyltransferase [Thermodesulfobacteriota bacterium]